MTQHSTGEHRPRTAGWHVAVVALSALALAVALGACGSASKESAGAVNISGLTTAEARLDAARQIPAKFEAPGPAVDASKASGKTACLIAADLSVPFSKNAQDGAIQALKAAGVKVIQLDHKYDPALAARLFDQCINQHADVIVSDSLPSDLLAQPISDARNAGIPYVETYINDPGPLPADARKRGVTAQINICTGCGGRLMSDWVIADSGGKANAVGIWDQGTPVGKFQYTAMEQELNGLCPTCSFKLQSVPSPLEWATRLPTMTQSIVLDQSVKYLMPVYDDMATIMAPAVSSGGADGRVKIVSYNANASALKIIKDGGPIKADAGELPSWIGYALADQLLRILTGEKPVENENIPIRLFDTTNIASIDLNAPPETWYGVDFKSAYLKLWGLK